MREFDVRIADIDFGSRIGLLFTVKENGKTLIAKPVDLVFEEIKQGVKSLSSLGITLDNSKSKKEVDELLKATDRLKTLQDDYGQQLAAVKLQQQEVNKANKEAAKDALGLTDAYSKLAKEYEKAARAAQNLTITKGKDAEETKKAVAAAQELGQKLKDTDASVGKFQRNVGNYANSLSGGFEKVAAEVAKLKHEQQGLQDLSKRNPIGFAVGGQDRLNQVNSSLQQLNNIQAIGANTTIGFTQKVKQLEKEYQNLVVSGNQTNEFLQQFKKFVADAKDQTEDLKAEIKALSSDTFVFDQIASGVKTMVAVFQIGASAAELFGANQEDVQRSIQKLVIIQNVANGVQEIANQLTLRGSVINKGYVFIQSLLTTAFNTSATAAARFNAALGLIGIAATVIGAIAIAFTAFKSSVDETVEKVDNLNEVMKDSKSAYTSAVTQVSNLRIQIDLAKKGFVDKKEAVKLYNETLGKTTGEVKSLEEAEKALEKNAKAYIEFTLLKAAANIALQKAAEKVFDAQMIDSTPIVLPDLKGLTPEIRAKKLKEFEDLSKGLKSFGKKVAEDQGEAFNVIAEKLLRQAAIKAKEFNFIINDAPGGPKSTDKSGDIQKEIAQTEGIALKDRLAALDKYVTERRALLLKANLTDEEFGLRSMQLVNEAAKIFEDITKSSIDTTKDAITEATGGEVIDVNALSSQFDSEWDKLTAAMVKKITASGRKLTEAEEKQIEDFKKAKADLFKQLGTESLGLGFDIVCGVLEQEKNAIQDQIDLLEKKKQKESEVANQSIDSVQNRAAAIAIIEARADAQREQLEKRQRDVQVKQARFERAASIASIIAKTAEAVIAAQKIVFPPGAGLILGGINAAIGAVQIARVLATPIPRYAKGTQNSPEGLAEVGEQGAELAIDKKGKATLYEKRTLTYLSKGTKIYPADVTKAMMRAAEQQRQGMMNSFNNNINVSVPDHGDKIDRLNATMKRIEQKSRIVIINNAPIESSPYYQHNMKY